MLSDTLDVVRIDMHQLFHDKITQILEKFYKKSERKERKKEKHQPKYETNMGIESVEHKDDNPYSLLDNDTYV